MGRMEILRIFLYICIWNPASSEGLFLLTTVEISRASITGVVLFFENPLRKFFSVWKNARRTSGKFSAAMPCL